jgi:NAD(P)-dependent dehydrogenase (short-subunit alcohol dehydrogenase family)
MEKVILITGTNSGFGKITARMLSEKGYKIYAGMRNVSSKNAEAAEELKNWEGVTVVDLDVTDTRAVNSVVEEIISKEGRLDVLINNAGVFTTGIAQSFTEEDLERIFDVNLKGPWRLLRATLPQFIKQKEGLIINVSSGLGRFSTPFFTIYNSSKFALEGLVEGSHYELKGLGIENVIVQPGAFPTELAAKTMTGSDESVLEGYGEIAQIPQKIGESLHELFSSEHAPNPDLVAEAMVNLIESPKGERPLRVVVDPLTGQFTEKANEQVFTQYKNFLGAFGMGELVAEKEVEAEI